MMSLIQVVGSQPLLRIKTTTSKVQPNRTVDNPIVTEQEIGHSTEESQIPEIEEKCSVHHNQSLLSSTQDSVESLAMPQEADLDDEQIRALSASPRYLPKREASAERSQIYHSEREGLLSSSSQSLNFIGTGKLVAWPSHHKRLGQDELSEREHVPRSYESVSGDANPANVAKSVLEGHRNHLLAQTRSELMKQEHVVDPADFDVVQLLVPRCWPGYQWYRGIRTTLGQFCIAECQL